MLEGTGCERVFLFSLKHMWLFHNPAQQDRALGAAYLTFTKAARALPVLQIKDNLAIKWNEAFEQAPNMCKNITACCKPHAHICTPTRTHMDKLGQIRADKSRHSLTELMQFHKRGAWARHRSGCANKERERQRVSETERVRDRMKATVWRKMITAAAKADKQSCSFLQDVDVCIFGVIRLQSTARAHKLICIHWIACALNH